MSDAAPPEIVVPERPVETFTLDNGLVLLVCEDRSAPVVSMQGWCRTGSIHEGSWTGAGLSHILEHMLFKGTESRGGTQVAAEVGGLGGQINAYTSFDRTVYYIDAPSASAAPCLDVLMDVVARAAIPADEFEREQEVIRREFAMGNDDPDRVASTEMFATAFQKHPYGVPVIGYLEVFDSLTRDDVLDYYRSRYAPNNLFFVVVGDVDPSAVHAQFVEFFAELPRRVLAPVYVPEEPTQLGRRDTFKAFTTPTTKLWMAWKVPGLTHADMPALDLLASVLGDGRSSRLHREVRERRGVVHRIDAFSYTPADAGLFAIGADVDPAKREAAEEAVFEEIEWLCTDGVERSELDKARKMALASQLSSLTSMRGQAATIGGNWMLTGNLNFTRDYLAKLAATDAETVVDAARRYFVDDTLNVIEVGETRAISAPSVNIGGGAGEAEEFALANGLRVIVQQDKRLPLVATSAAFRAGLLAENDANSGATALLASSLFQGTTKRSAEELAEATESLGGSAGAGGGNNSFFVNAGVMAPDIDVAFEISAEVLVAPAFPDDAVGREREAQLADIDEDDQRPTGAAFQAAKSALFGQHPFARRRSGERTSVSALGPEELRAFHQQYAVGNNGVLSVCGDVEPARIRDLAEQHFGQLEAGVQAFPSPAGAEWPSALQERVEHRDKEQAVVVVALPGVDLASPDRPALDLIEEACSGMDGRLFLRIREELGLAYFTGATQLVGLAPGALLFYVGTRPDAADDVVGELLSEIEKIATGGLGADEIEHAKQVYAGKLSIDRQSPGARAQSAALDVLYDLGFGHDQKHLERISALDSATVADVASRYLSNPSKVCVKVLP